MDQATWDRIINRSAFRLLRCVWYWVPPTEAQQAWRSANAAVRPYWARRLRDEAMRRRAVALSAQGFAADARNLGDVVGPSVARPASRALAAAQRQQLDEVLVPWALAHWEVLSDAERQDLIDEEYRTQARAPQRGNQPRWDDEGTGGAAIPQGTGPKPFGPVQSGIKTDLPLDPGHEYRGGKWLYSADRRDPPYTPPVP